VEDIKNMTDVELHEELNRASERLAKTESSYVQAQNLCSTIEGELARRDSQREKSIPRAEVLSLVEKWSVKAADIQKAADASKGDPKAQNSLSMHRDLLQVCIADLYRILGH
jgi:hypothetical protein